MNDKQLHLLMDASQVLKAVALVDKKFADESERLADALSQFIADYINEPAEVDLPY